MTVRHHLQILGTPPDRGYVWKYPKHSELQLVWDGKLLPEGTDVSVEYPAPYYVFLISAPRTIYCNTVTINNKTYQNCKVTVGPLPKECQ